MDRLGTTYTGCEVQHYPTILSVLTQQEKPKVYLLEELFQISKVGVYLKIFLNALQTEPKMPIFNGPPF